MFDWNIALGNFMEEELEEKYKLYISVDTYVSYIARKCIFKDK